MSNGWSPSDKILAKKLFVKAKASAENETLRHFRDSKIKNVSDLWQLELKIRQWRKVNDRLYLNYTTIENDLILWIRKGWLGQVDLKPFSDDRRVRIIKNLSHGNHP